MAMAVTSCARRTPTAIPQTPDPSRGEASFRFLLDPEASPGPSLEPNQEFLPPTPIDALRPPAYPEAPLRVGFGSSTVVVRILVGPEGNVVEVRDSPVMEYTPGPFAASFRAATEEAVRAWRFVPGEIRTLVDGKDIDGDGKPDYKIRVSSVLVPVFYDVRFDFEIVRGEGRVRTRSLDPPARRTP